MDARQKLILVIGLGIIGLAVFFRVRGSIASGDRLALPGDSTAEPSSDTITGSIQAAARRVWDAIPSTPWLSLLRSTEQALGLPDTLLTRMAWIESRFNPNAFNARSGATGILQIVPRVHPNVDAKNPASAIPYAGAYLKQLFNQFGSWEKAVAAYNWGPGNLQNDLARLGENWKAGLPAETSNYLAQVNQVIDLPA